MSKGLGDKDICIFTNVAPHYREALWVELLGCKRFNYYFYFGEIPTLGIKGIDFKAAKYASYKNRIKYVENILINKKRVVWQRGVVWSCFTKDIKTAIFLGDLYCLSTWFASIICRLRGIDVAFWGHGLYGREGRVRLMIKKMFFRLAHKHLLYERRAKRLMQSLGFQQDRLYVVFNSLNYEKQLQYRDDDAVPSKKDVFGFFRSAELPTIVFIGRLTVQKKLYLLLQAVLEINITNVAINLLIIGSGGEEEELKRFGQNGVDRGWLHFAGALYDEQEIAKYLCASDLCVSPGNVGLTCIHSMGYGTPVCTHGDLRYQMPEAEAIVDGYNGFYFERDNVDDLKEKIKWWFAQDTDRKVLRGRCYEVIDKYYNPHYQLQVFTRLVDGKKPEI